MRNILLLTAILTLGVGLTWAGSRSESWTALTKNSAYMSALRAKAAQGDEAAKAESDERALSWLALTKDISYMAALRAEATKGSGIAQEEMVLRTPGQESWEWLQRCAPTRGVCAYWMAKQYQGVGVLDRNTNRFVEPDPIKALDWSRKSAALGNSDGMLEAAAMLKKPDAYGSLWPRDLALAEQYYVQAYEAGEPYGAIEMGLWAMDPNFGGPDFAKAELWYKRAGPKGEGYLSYVRKRKSEAMGASQPHPSAGPYPPRPAKRQGVVSCATNCNNADCYRTYDDGRQVHFQAQQKWNPFENRFDFDSGGC